MKTYPVPSDTMQLVINVLSELPFRSVHRVMGQLEQIILQVDGPLETPKTNSGDTTKTNSWGNEQERPLIKRVNN